VIPTDYFEKLTAHQCHVISLHQKHDDFSGEISNKDEKLFLTCWPMLQLVHKVKISSSQKNGTWKLRIV